MTRYQLSLVLTLLAMAVPVAAVQFEMAFSGLLSIASDGTNPPSEIWVLAPDATQPSAIWLPAHFQMGTEHEVALLVVKGSTVTPTAGWKRFRWCIDNGDYDGISLYKSDLQFASPVTPSALQPSLASRANPNQRSNDVESLLYLAEMESLSSSPPVQAFSASLIQADCAGSCTRMAMRMKLDRGRLRTGRFWESDDPTTPPDSRILNVKFSPGNHQQYLAASFVLGDQLGGNLKLEVRPLGIDVATPSLIEIAPVGGEIMVVVQNAPIDCAKSSDDHFSYHFLLREGWDNLSSSAQTSTPQKKGTAGSNANPQCSPANQNVP